MYARTALPTLFKDVFGEDFLAPWHLDQARCHVPGADVWETDNDLRFAFDLPGTSKKDISVEFNDGVLTIAGERKPVRDDKVEKVYSHERFEGKFSRSFRIGDGYDHTKISARFEDGVLHVSIPRKEETKPVSIKVQ
jgi:HSP20 family protein